MLNIKQVDHVGIRVSDKERSVGFYEGLGFALDHDDMRSNRPHV